MIGQTLILFLEALVYPGLLFMVFFIILTQWLARKLVARIQFRRGPIYAGPAGFLQPMADLLKLVMKKDLINKYSMKISPLIAVALGIGALISITVATPIAFQPIYGDYDFIIILYLLLMVPFTLAYLAVAHPNPYTAIGAGRFVAQLFSSEPAFALSLLVPVIIASKEFNASYSLYMTSIYSAYLWDISFSKTLAMILAAIAGFLGLLAVLMVKPFDTPEAESELYWGIFTELGGPRLALGFFLKFAEKIVYPLIYSLLFLGGIWPASPDNWLAGTVAVLFKTIMVFIAITVIDASLPRYRPDQAVKFMWKYLYPISIIAILLSII